MTAALLLAALASLTPAPINLIVRAERGVMRFNVVGLAPDAYPARYVLDVAGEGPGGANRTTQAGATVLRPNEAATLLSVAIGMGDGGRWTATLTVTPAQGAPYRQQRTSPAPPAS